MLFQGQAHQGTANVGGGTKSSGPLAQIGSVLKAHSSLMVAFEKMKYNEQPCNHYLNSIICHIYLYICIFAYASLHMYFCVYVSLMHHSEIPQHLVSKIKDILQHNHNDIFTLKECNIGTLQLSNIQSAF